MKKVLLKIHSYALGDTLCSTPALRKLSKAYGCKISVKSKYPHLFKNSPYVDCNFLLEEDVDESQYEVLSCFERESVFKNSNIESYRKIHACDRRRSCAYDLGFDLLDEEIIQKLLTFQHSRVLVKTNSPENILGLLDTQKIIKQLNIHDALNKITKSDLEALITEPYFIPSGTPLYTQLQNFQDKQERIGLIVNEHGEFIGLLSLEDILEEVVGEFNLDFLSRSSKFSQDEDGGWIVDGSVTIRTLNKKLNLHFPIDGPKTLNGLVLEYFEDIPEPNTSFKIANHTLEVLQSHDRIVKSIKIYPLS